MYIIDWETYFEYEGMQMVVAGYNVDKEIVEGVEEGFEISAEAEIYVVEEEDGRYEFLFWGITPAKIRKKRKGWELVELELD